MPRSSTGTATSASPPACRGRFAPSPTGPLHIGSLLAAVASYLDARARRGQWLVRIEDLDPPREQPGAADDILRALEAFDLGWDEPVVYQSQRADAYEAALETLAREERTYRCVCSRQDIAQTNAARGLAGSRVYPGTCRGGVTGRRRTRVVRMLTVPGPVSVDDRLQGEYSQDIEQEVGDFVLRRRDGLAAYQLAVVVDDAWQEITDIVRGIDLLDSTPRQVWVQRALGIGTPTYMHVPVVVTADGEKLSKQTGAAPLDLEKPSEQAWAVLQMLRQSPPSELRGEAPATLWEWATPRWDPQHLHGITAVRP